jgi:hypothetical protein
VSVRPGLFTAQGQAAERLRNEEVVSVAHPLFRVPVETQVEIREASRKSAKRSQ